MTVLKKLQAGLDVYIGRIKVGRSLVGVKRVGCLVVARLIQSSKVIPDLRNVGVESDSTRVGIQCVAVLVDLIVQDTDTAPESGVTPVAVDGLLVSLVCLGVLLLGHVASTKEVPTLCISLIGGHRLLQVFNSLLLAGIVGALLVVQPTQLLQYLGVVGVAFKHSTIGALSGLKFLLLLVDMPNLEPDILFSQRARWVGDDVLEALWSCQYLIWGFTRLYLRPDSG